MAINDEQNARIDALEKEMQRIKEWIENEAKVLKEQIASFAASDAMRADNPANDARNIWLDNVLAKYFANDKPVE